MTEDQGADTHDSSMDPGAVAPAETPVEAIKTVSPQARKAEIAAIIEQDGIFAVHPNELAKKYGVSHTQISRDVQEIVEESPKLNWSAVLNRSLMELDHAIKVVSQEMNSAEGKLKGTLASQLSEMTVKKADLLAKIERLLPAGAKPEPITITYRRVDPGAGVSKDG